MLTLGNLYSLLLLAAAAVTGFRLAQGFLPKETSPKVKLAAGFVVGNALLAWCSYLIALGFREMNTASALLTAALFFVPCLIYYGQYIQNRQVTLSKPFSWIRPAWGDLFYYAFWVLFLGAFFFRIFRYDPRGIATAPINNYGDLPYHLNIISAFLYGKNFPPQDISYAGIRHAYPFLVDFLNAFLIHCGSGWGFSFFIVHLTLGISMLLLLEELGVTLTQNKLAGRWTPFIFFLSGGFDFLVWIGNIMAKPTSHLQTLINMIPSTHVFTRSLNLAAWGDIPLRWGDRLTMIILTQRSTSFGIPLSALILILLYHAVHSEGNPEFKRRTFFAAGTLLGALPLLHTYGFLSIGFISVILMLMYWSWNWFVFFVPAVSLSVLQVLWLLLPNGTNHFLQTHIGWERGTTNPFLFWMINNGILIWTVIFFLLLSSHKKLKRFYSPFLLWFIIPNLCLVAPTSWDNHKMIVYWVLISSPVAALALARLWQHRSLVLRVLGGCILVLMNISGAMYCLRGLSPVEKSVIFSKTDMGIAERIREKTPPRSIFLHTATHNSTVALSGRLSFLGYVGNVWTHGINHTSREQDLRKMFAGGSTAISLLSLYGIDYVLIGPQERRQGPYVTVNESFFDKNFKKIIDQADYKVFEIPRLHKTHLAQKRT